MTFFFSRMLTKDNLHITKDMKQSLKLAILSKFKVDTQHHVSRKQEKKHCTKNLKGQIKCKTR
jgi:hypothetical protein